MCIQEYINWQCAKQGVPVTPPDEVEKWGQEHLEQTQEVKPVRK